MIETDLAAYALMVIDQATENGPPQSDTVAYRRAMQRAALMTAFEAVKRANRTSPMQVIDELFAALRN